MLERRRSFQGSSRCSATPQTVWAVWTNAGEWQGGVVEAVEIDGDFGVGARYTTKVKGYPRLTSTVIRINPLRPPVPAVPPRAWTPSLLPPTEALPPHLRRRCRCRHCRRKLRSAEVFAHWG
jgi:hypothetical protein